MDKTFDRVIKNLEEHAATHKRMDIGRKRRHLLRDCYERLKVLETRSLMGVQHNKTSAKIRIVSHHLLSCSEAPALTNLIGISDVCTIKTCQSGFIIDLEFNLWRWVESKNCP